MVSGSLSAVGQLKRVRKLEGHMTAAKQAFTQRDFEGARDEYTAALVRAARGGSNPPGRP